MKNVSLEAYMLPAEDFHQKVLCFAAKVATWTLFAMQQISGGCLSASELDLPNCSLGSNFGLM